MIGPALDERLRMYPRIAVAVAVPCILGWWIAGEGYLDPGSKPVGGDFVSLYAAGRLALAGAPEAAWDLSRVHAEVVHILGAEVGRLPFHYAPPALLLLAPFAALPFVAGWLSWLAAGLLTWAAPLRLARVDAREAGLLFASPAVLEGVLHGQTGGFVAGLLGAGLCLVERRPLLAGALIGGALFKPQYLVAPAVALVAAGRWRALVGLVGAVLAQLVVVTAAFGFAPWAAFVANVPFATRVLLEGGVDWWKLTTVTAAALQLGLGPTVAQGAQLVASLGAVGVAAVVYRRGGPLGDAAVLVAALLATPFAFGYDWMLLAPALLAIARNLPSSGRARRVGQVALVAAWGAPWAHQLLAMAGLPIGPLVLALLLGVAAAPAGQRRGNIDG